MTLNSMLSHELTNNVENVLLALETIELKLLQKDISGALKTLSLIKTKKSCALETITKIKSALEEEIK